jgi:hypothetical protein
VPIQRVIAPFASRCGRARATKVRYVPSALRKQNSCEKKSPVAKAVAHARRVSSTSST